MEKLYERLSEIYSDLKRKEINLNISAGTVTDWAMGYFMLL